MMIELLLPLSIFKIVKMDWRDGSAVKRAYGSWGRPAPFPAPTSGSSKSCAAPGDPMRALHPHP